MASVPNATAAPAESKTPAVLGSVGEVGVVLSLTEYDPPALLIKGPRRPAPYYGGTLILVSEAITEATYEPVAWWVYLAFVGFVIAMLLVDLVFFHTEEHEPTMKESGIWVGVWVTLALIFGVVVYFWKGGESTAQYFAGYLIEYSLSVDNMFVFVVIFSYFAIPFAYQHQVLFYGILGAIVFRGSSSCWASPSSRTSSGSSTCLVPS